MRRGWMLVILLVLAVVVCVPVAAAGFDTKQLADEATKVQGFIFGWGTKIAAIFGAAIGVIKAILTGSIQPLLFFGGISLCVGLLPKFIEMLFSAAST